MTHKLRMLNAYRGVYSDFIPVAPEFWFYYPAKVLGVSMIELQREIPHWKAMLETVRKFDTEGWCVAYPSVNNPHISGEGSLVKIDEGRYREKRMTRYFDVQVESSVIFDKVEPCWMEEYPIKTEKELHGFMKAMLTEDINYDFKPVIDAWEGVGEDILVECNVGEAFFDFICNGMGFENAIDYFLSDHEKVLEQWLNLYIEQKTNLLRKIAEYTPYEAVFIGCSMSCNSLLGPNLWRKWDKPFLKAITQEAHRLGLLVHSHNHGRIMDTVPDLVEIGFDCVCPFEREPGDVIGIEGLKKVRTLLDDKVTFNGNVSTIGALLKNTPDDVRREVREIKEAFCDTPRVIIGTGDQVAGTTPEENIYAMVAESRS